eukprot:scaffold222577_cov15-Tisochrysis_lutea.AAC.1
MQTYQRKLQRSAFQEEQKKDGSGSSSLEAEVELTNLHSQRVDTSRRKLEEWNASYSSRNSYTLGVERVCRLHSSYFQHASVKSE